MARPKLQSELDASHNVQRQEAESESQTVHGPYPTKPGQDVIDRFGEHVRKTGQPETFSTIERSTPPDWSPPYILRKFDVDRHKRPNRDEAPCAICSPYKAKCLHNMYLVWYEMEAAIRAIGPECGDHIENGGLYALAKVEHDRREAHQVAENFLESNLATAPQMLSGLCALREGVAEAQRLHRKLRHDVSAIPNKLRQIKNKHGGLLTVDVEIPREQQDDEVGKGERIGPRGFGRGDGGVDTYTQEFGSIIAGASIFASRFEPCGKLEELITLAENLPKVAIPEEAYLWMCDNESLELFERVVMNIRAVDAGYQQLKSQLESIANFFSQSFIYRLNLWGQHPANDFPLVAEMSAGVCSLVHNGRKARLKPNMEVLSLWPSWPNLVD